MTTCVATKGTAPFRIQIKLGFAKLTSYCRKKQNSDWYAE